MFDKQKIEELYPEAGELMLEPMLINKPSSKAELEQAFTSGEYFLETKKDGYLYQFVKTPNHSYLFSRSVSKTTGLLSEKIANVPHIAKALDGIFPNTILVGEVYFPGGSSKTTSTVMGCLPAKAIERQRENPIHYYLFDIIYCNGVSLLGVGAEERYEILKSFYNKFNLAQYNFIELAEKIDKNLAEETAARLAQGEEGVVLKRKDAPYSPGKRPAHVMLKVKQLDEIDLVCTRTIPATKEYTGKEAETWPYWIIEHNGLFHKKCEVGKPEYIRSPEFKTIPVSKPYYFGWHTAIGIGAYDPSGNLVELGTVSSGFTDEERAAMGADPASFVGKTVGLRCMSIDRKEKTLRHPVFVQWRDDKPGADCLIKEIFG